MLFRSFIAMFVALWLAAGARAEEKNWWPFSAENWSSGSAVATGYVPLQEKASKKWHLCAIVPHLKDSWWVAINYGEVMEARRLRVKLTVFQAGGYTELSKQISQYDDRVALGADAILSSVISEEGLNRKIEAGRAQGIIQVSVGNPVRHGPVRAKVFADQPLRGFISGNAMVDCYSGRDSVRAVAYPGPQGSGWAEDFDKDFQQAMEGSNTDLLESKYGDTGKSVQLKLVEDAPQAHDGVDLLWGVAVMAEVVPGAIEEAGLADKIKVMATNANQGMLDAVTSGDVLGAATQSPVTEGRIGVDLAVRIPESKSFIKEVHPVPQPIAQQNIASLDLTRLCAEGLSAGLLGRLNTSAGARHG